ncbi:MAG: hypothetical protein WCB78_12620 [Pseudolabrys sp.]
MSDADETAKDPNHSRTSEIDEPVKHEREAVWRRPAPSGNDFPKSIDRQNCNQQDHQCTENKSRAEQQQIAGKK